MVVSLYFFLQRDEEELGEKSFSLQKTATCDTLSCNIFVNITKPFSVELCHAGGFVSQPEISLFYIAFTVKVDLPP